LALQRLSSDHQNFILNILTSGIIFQLLPLQPTAGLPSRHEQKRSDQSLKKAKLHQKMPNTRKHNDTFETPNRAFKKKTVL